MRLAKGDREGQWFARFPRNDELCCNYEAHVLLANMGNVDWRPCLNLWAVVQYVTKYATKAPKGSRRLHDLLKDAVDEVCTYLPEGQGNDFLKRSIQKFFARTMGERDFHAFEAVQLGLQLPLVMPLMPVVSLNTSGSRPLKSYSVLQGGGPDEPVHYDSRVDKFNKRLQFVRRQFKGEELTNWEEEVRDVSLYEFYWKYCFYRGKLKRSATDVCLMVTPAYSADCANVQHAAHEGYARVCVLAYWRHMETAARHAAIEQITQHDSKQPPCVYWGATKFTAPLAHAGFEEADAHLGTRELYLKFDCENGWGFALMEMLVDPMLVCWVPVWVREQYERANPYFRAVLKRLETCRVPNNRALLRRTKKEMVKRHAVHLHRAKVDGGPADVQKGGSELSEESGGASDRAACDTDDPDAVASRLLEAEADGQSKPVEMIWDPLPMAGGIVGTEGGIEGDADWNRAGIAERLSAAGAAAPAADATVGHAIPDNSSGHCTGGRSSFGVTFNPPGRPDIAVHWGENSRLQELAKEWYGQAVGDGADAVGRDELDPWQKFAHDIVSGPPLDVVGFCWHR